MSSNLPTLEQAREFYVGADSAHDFEHILRVAHMAEHLAEQEGGDVAVIRAAALLHDIARHEQDYGAAKIDHAEVSAQDAAAFLVEHGADSVFAAQVADAIRTHRFRGTAQPQTQEARILFDADKLDSIGAIGVARAYAICGLLNQKLYSEPQVGAVATQNQHNAEHTPVQEYHVKLRHLHTRFYTPTARKIAQERHAYMEGFFAQLTREVKGKA